MLTLRQLLLRSPTSALVDLFVKKTNVTLQEKNVRFSTPIDQGNGVTLITLSVVKANGTLDKFIKGSSTFSYKRINVDTVFDSVERSVEVKFPTTTETILRKLKEIIPFVNDENDFIADVMITNPGVYILRANPKSLRWYGNASITVIQEPPSVGDIFPNHYLDGLWYENYTPPAF